MQVIIVGGGKTGAHLASRLTDDGIAVTVIEQRHGRRHRGHGHRAAR